MYTTVENLKVNDYIQAVFLNSFRDGKWHKVFQIDINYSRSTVYLAVEGFGSITLPFGYEVERK